MAKIIQFQPQIAGFSFKRVNGYNIVPGDIIKDYYKTVIKGWDVGPFIIKHYDVDGDTVYIIDDGIVIPTTDEEEEALNEQGIAALPGILRNHGCDIDELVERKKKLDIAIDQANSDASFYLHKRTIYQRHTESGYDIITLKCDDGCVSCGWYDYSKTDKLGLKMSAFMLYSLGFVNTEDKKKRSFWHACHNVLRHSSELDCDEADQIIVKGLEKIILEKAPAPTVFESSDLW